MGFWSLPQCRHIDDCPIADWPDEPTFESAPPSEPTSSLYGPSVIVQTGQPEAVWLTGESLGLADPARLVSDRLPIVVVFDEPLLARLQLSSKRIVFLVETLAELASQRTVELRLGDPTVELADRPVAVTHAPVPGFVTRSRAANTAEIHPWPWLIRPTGQTVRSFSSWRRSVEVAR